PASAFSTTDTTQTIRSSDGRSRPLSSDSTAVQIVGTPAANVTRSDSRRVAMARGERSAPGRTNVAPAKTAECANPQQLAWNIGTIGRMTSDSETPRVSTNTVAIECSTVERCE